MPSIKGIDLGLFGKAVIDSINDLLKMAEEISYIMSTPYTLAELLCVDTQSELTPPVKTTAHTNLVH